MGVEGMIGNADGGLQIRSGKAPLKERSDDSDAPFVRQAGGNDRHVPVSFRRKNGASGLNGFQKRGGGSHLRVGDRSIDQMDAMPFRLQ